MCILIKKNYEWVHEPPHVCHMFWSDTDTSVFHYMLQYVQWSHDNGTQVWFTTCHSTMDPSMMHPMSRHVMWWCEFKRVSLLTTHVMQCHRYMHGTPYVMLFYMRSMTIRPTRHDDHQAREREDNKLCMNHDKDVVNHSFGMSHVLLGSHSHSVIHATCFCQD